MRGPEGPSTYEGFTSSGRSTNRGWGQQSVTGRERGGKGKEGKGNRR